MAVVTAYVDQVQKAYIAYYGRPADTTGLDYWTNQLSTVGGSWTSLINAFGNSAEATTLLAGLTTEQKVNKLYQQLFGRDADVSGLTYYSVGIANGSFTLASVAINILNGASGTDVTTVANKLTSAKLFTNDLTTAAAITGYNSSTVSDVRTWLAAVTTTAATQASADAAVSAVVNNGSINGTTYTLTTGVDTLTGTANNDSFVATINSASNAYDAANSTLQVADTLDGAGGIDTLSITVTGATSNADIAVPAAGLKNVEVLKVRSTIDTATASKFITVDASLVPGLTAVYSDRSTSKGDVKITNLATGAAAGIIGDGSVTGGALNFGYKTAADAATLNVANGANAGAVTIATTPAAVTINSTGAANTVGAVALGAAATGLTVNATTNLKTGNITGFTGTAATITVAGAATTVDLGTIENATVKTITASGLTAGGVKATLSTNTGISFTGGVGKDTITTGAVLASGASVDAGAGTDDTLVVANSAHLTAATGVYYKNFEVLSNATAAALDVSTISGVTSLVTAVDQGGFSKMTATQAAAVTVTASNTSGTAYALADYSGTSDVLGVTIKDAVATNVDNLQALTITGFETLNVTASSGGTDATKTAGTNFSNVNFTAAANLTKITAAGAYALGVDVSSNAVKVATIDASNNTAGVAVTTGGQTVALTVTGTGAADVFAAGTMGSGGAQTINAGAGNDSVTGTQANIYAATVDGGTGTDTLKVIDNGLTVNDQTFKNVTNIEKLNLSGIGTLTFTVGGYANSNIAGANAGVLDVTAAALTVGAAIDASGLGGTNSLKLALTNADVGGNGAISVITSNGGADSITISGTNGSGNITVNGAANTKGFTADVSGVTASTGTITLTGGAGADTIKAMGLVASITGGAGADAITLAAADGKAQTLTVNTANQSTTTAYDTVTNFQMVATNGDLLKFASTTLLSGAQLGTGWTLTNGVATKSGATVADFISAFSTATTAGVSAFSDGTNMWAAYSDGTASLTTSDQVVELLGITATAVSATAAANTIGIV